MHNEQALSYVQQIQLITWHTLTRQFNQYYLDLKRSYLLVDRKTNILRLYFWRNQAIHKRSQSEVRWWKHHGWSHQDVRHHLSGRETAILEFLFEWRQRIPGDGPGHLQQDRESTRHSPEEKTYWLMYSHIGGKTFNKDGSTHSKYMTKKGPRDDYAVFGHMLSKGALTWAVFS